MKNLNKQYGVALLEVLIAFVIVTVSVVALYQLQNVYLRSEINSSAKLSALHLAESKLDDLRTFSSLSTTTSAASAGLPSYDEINNDIGGSGILPAGSAAVGNFTYDLHWAVSDAGASKEITVTVSGVNNTEQVQLSGSIARTEQVSQKRLTSSSLVENTKPVVSYAAGVAPDVISIDLDSNGTKQETTKPLPEVANNGGSIQAQFSTITYDSTNTQIQSDFNTISCSCTITGSASSSLPAYPYMTDTDLLYWKTGSSVTKQTGTVANNQPTLCSVCCTNHFDGASTENSDFINYYNQLNRNAVKNSYNGSYTSVTSGSYIDSCRLLRIDGYYKPMPDWNLVKLNVMSVSYLSDTANVAKYQEYIKYVVKAYVTLMKSSSLWGPSNDNRGVFGASTFTSTSAYTSAVDTSGIMSFSAWLTSNGYSNTSLTMVVGDTPVQLISRGIFIDFLSDEDGNNDGVIDSWINDINVNDADAMAKIPFYDINMTLLSRWSSENGSVSVANEIIKTLDSTDSAYYGVYRRGYITPISVSASGGVDITATAYQGNSSVAAYQYNNSTPEVAVSEFERDYGRSGSINVNVSSSAASDGTISIIGRVYCYDKANNGGVTDCVQGQTNYLNNIRISGTSATCQLETSGNEKAYLLYNCKVTPPATGSVVVITMSSSGFTVSPSSASLAVQVDATSPVNGACFKVYNSALDLTAHPLPTIAECP